MFGDSENARGDDASRRHRPHHGLRAVYEVRLDTDIGRAEIPRQEVIHDSLQSRRKGTA